MTIGNVQQLQRRAAIVWERQHAVLLATAITLLAALLRLFRSSANGLRLDELWSLWLAEQPVTAITRFILIDRGDATPPTYYLLLHTALQFGQSPLALRALSILAGTLTVWLTFWLAAELFDLRVAVLSALLLAVAPLQIEYAQVARAYALGSLWAVLSLLLTARLVVAEPRRSVWLSWGIVCVAAFYTHYLTALLILYEIAVLLLRHLHRRTIRPWLVRWLGGIAALCVVLLPTLFSVLAHLSPRSGQEWLAPPGWRSFVKSGILFSTGDPSYGPTGLTAARVLSLIVFAGIAALAITSYLQMRRSKPEQAVRVRFLAGAVALPWLVTAALSQVRPLYHEKYLLFLMPPLCIVLAWGMLHTHRRNVGLILCLLLIGLNGRGLVVYYTAPVGEQWREALAYLNAARQPEDLVIISPGFYGRAYDYYVHGSFSAEMQQLRHSAAVVVRDGTFGDLPNDLPLAPNQRIWLVTGHTPPHASTVDWLEQWFVQEADQRFVGARVRLFEAPRR